MSTRSRRLFTLALLLALLNTEGTVPSRALTVAWSGRLQITGKTFVDGTGQPVLPLCAHFGEAFSAWVRRPADVENQLHAIKDADYDCIRFWDNLGEYSEAWRGKEISPFSWINQDGVRVEATPNYYERLKQFLELLKRIGLTAQHSRGDLGRDKPAVPLDRVVEHSKRIAAIYDAIGWDVLALYEGNNEDFQNGNFGPAGLLQIVEPMKTRGALVASSCPAGCSQDKSAVASYSRGFSVRYHHSHRGGTATDRLAARFTMGYDAPQGAPYLGWDGEPIGPKHDPGPGVSVNSTQDPEEIGLLHTMTFVGGRAATTYMSQRGVFWTGPLHRQAGFYATPQMRAVLHKFAPDVMRWSLYHGARREAVLRSPDGYMGDAGVTHGPARLDQAVSTDRRRVVAVIYGGRSPTRFRNDLQCTAQVTVVWPRDDEQVQQTMVRLAPGEVFEVDYRVGRLLLGRCVN